MNQLNNLFFKCKNQIYYFYKINIILYLNKNNSYKKKELVKNYLLKEETKLLLL